MDKKMINTDIEDKATKLYETDLLKRIKGGSVTDEDIFYVQYLPEDSVLYQALLVRARKDEKRKLKYCKKKGLDPDSFDYLSRDNIPVKDIDMNEFAKTMNNGR